MRRRLAIFSVIAATAALAMGGLGVVGAGADTNTGTIKIFDQTKNLPANEPKPNCEFTVEGLFFDAGEKVDVHIEGQGGPNVAGTGTFDETVTTDAEGAFSTSLITLPDGMYKANADDGEGGGDKNKVFTVGPCPPEVPVTPTQPTQPTQPTAPKAVTPPAAQAPSAVVAQPVFTG
jgi:hypothetical protein